MNWQELIPACFGCDDLEFGQHALDRQRAIEMFISALSAGISMRQIVHEVRAYLTGKAEIRHINRQIRIVRNLGI